MNVIRPPQTQSKSAAKVRRRAMAVRDRRAVGIVHRFVRPIRLVGDRRYVLKTRDAGYCVWPTVRMISRRRSMLVLAHSFSRAIVASREP